MNKELILVPDLNTEAVLKCFREYMQFVVGKRPKQKQYLMNIEAKIIDDDFKGDITALIKPTEKYHLHAAYELVKEKLVEKI